MSTGWIKMHRSFLEWEWVNDLPTMRLFMQLLLKANHKDRKWQGITINEGQVLTGLNALVGETELSIRQIRRSLTKLEKTGEIVRKTSNKFSIITVCNYSTYQDEGQTKVKQGSNKGQAEVKQRSTNKNVKNVKNEKNTSKKEVDERFEKAWIFYGRIGNKADALAKWKKLSEKQIAEVKVKIGPYVKSTTTDGTYPSRKNFSTYLNKEKEYWNDEIVDTKGNPSSGNYEPNSAFKTQTVQDVKEAERIAFNRSAGLPDDHVDEEMTPEQIEEFFSNKLGTKKENS